MNLLETLTKAGVAITATPNIVDIPATQEHKPPHKAFRVTVSMKFPDEEQPVVRDWRDGTPYNEHQTLETWVSAMVREHRPGHPAFQAWLQSRGHVPVQLSDAAVGLGAEPWGESVHTGLRKLSSSLPSSMAWHSLHEVPAPVAAAVWAVVREAVETELARLGATRRSCAIAVKRALEAALGWGTPGTNMQSVLQYRTHPKFAEFRKNYATAMLSLAIESSPLEDFMYAWLGYVLHDKLESNEEH